MFYDLIFFSLLHHNFHLNAFCNKLSYINRLFKFGRRTSLPKKTDFMSVGSVKRFYFAVKFLFLMWAGHSFC